MYMTLCLCIEQYACILQASEEKYRSTLTLAFPYSVIFSASLFSQTFVVLPKTGPCQGHRCVL